MGLSRLLCLRYCQRILLTWICFCFAVIYLTLVLFFQKVGNAVVYGSVAIVGHKTKAIAEILMAMCSRQTFREKRIGTKRKSDSSVGESCLKGISSSSPPLFSCSRLAQEDDAYIFRFIAYSVESAYLLLSEVLFPLHTDIGVHMYRDRLQALQPAATIADVWPLHKM